MSSTSAVAVVEALLHEFYNPSTPAGRKRQIENDLLAYKHSPESWQVCLRTAVCSKEPQASEFLFFFAVSTLEHAITRRWEHLTLADRSLMRDTLWNAYVHLPLPAGGGVTAASADAACVRRQKDCYAQLIALLGKREFPDEHPNYMSHCVALLKTKLPLGISLLRVTSEEVVSNRENVTTERKSYFHSCISMCMPEVMDLLTKYLLIAVCYVNQKDVHTFTNSAVMDYTLLTALPNNGSQWQTPVVDLLNCLQHLISWISTDYISEYLLMSVLDLSQYRGQHKEITLSAVAVLNELLYLQKALPCDVVLVAGVCGLLEHHNTVKPEDEMYMDKFRELLRLCTAKYWSKMLNEGELLDRFLKSLYCLTTLRNGALDFTEKLEIWTPLIKGLSGGGKANRYSDMLHQLVAETMRRTQFSTNKAELELLDNETIEDNTQTEWQQFLTQCIECVALIAEARPNAVFAHVFAHWSRPHAYLMSVQHDLEQGGGGGGGGMKSIDLTSKFKAPQLGEHLRDCSTICQAVVRLAPLLDPTTESNSEVQVYLQMLVDTLLAMLGFCCAVSPKLMSSYDLELYTFQVDLDYLHAHVLMALRSVLAIKSSQLRSDEMLHRLFAPLSHVFQAGQTVTLAPIIYLAASELLLCVATELRPKCLLDIPTLQNLVQLGALPNHLPRTVAANVYISVIAYFVLPWKNVSDSEQNYTRRCVMLREYVQTVAQCFLELDLNGAESKVFMVAVNFLTTFSLVLEYFRDCNNTTKEMLVNVFKPVITQALIIYNTFSSTSSNTNMLASNGVTSAGGGCGGVSVCVAVAEFTLSGLRTLQTQLGIQFIRELITLFITANSRERAAASRLAVLERVLQMFQLIVQQPGSASLSLVPAILDFVIAQVLPLLQENSNADNTDIAVVVYSLFDNILTCKWQYFYKPHLAAQYSTQPQNHTAENLHPEHFMAMLNAYGQALVNGMDPNHVRIVLSSMQSVNERWRLYQRPLFRDNLLTSFQRALVNALIGGSAEGALHRELLTNALFAMGQIDTLKMRELFAEAGFATYSKAIDDICLATDIPTFSQKLDQLIQDAHCLQLNQS